MVSRSKEKNCVNTSNIIVLFGFLLAGAIVFMLISFTKDAHLDSQKDTKEIQLNRQKDSNIPSSRESVPNLDIAHKWNGSLNFVHGANSPPKILARKVKNEDINVSASVAATALLEGCVPPLDNFVRDNYSHMVPPPPGPVHLVCCRTTVGPLLIAVHPSWAPIGAARFMDMVQSKFFSSQVPLFRALKGFLVQFGLAGKPSVQQEFNRKGSLEDDPSWLPLGPTNRDINGVKRYQKGYVGYAGSGKHSRGTQLIVALEDNGPLGGGSPWEVPFAQLIGKRSFKVLNSIYTGYGEKPSQGKIQNKGIEYIHSDFPLLDVIHGCDVIAENVLWHSADNIA